LLGKFIFLEQSKTKVNGFAMGVANKKQHLHSCQQPLSLESPIEDVDELLRRCGG
jgi:hypothetical protein